jgi:hypothetical protein
MTALSILWSIPTFAGRVQGLFRRKRAAGAAP